MNEQELREKIIGIVLDVPITGIKIREILGGEATANAIADALIEAGIGDVSELKKHRMMITKDGTIKQLYSGEEVEQIVKERNTYKRALQIAEEFGELCAPASNYVQQAEKELAEERKDD